MLAEMIAQLTRRCFQLPYNIGHESLLAVRTIFTRDDDSFTHLRMTTQRRFDLAQLDTETTHFHLIVHATEKLEIPIRHVTHQIARTIETGARLSGRAMWDESFGRQSRLVEIRTRESGATDEQL